MLRNWKKFTAADDTPQDGKKARAISSNWAYDHNAADTGVHGAGADTLATDADITTHEAAADPHTGYQREGQDIVLAEANKITFGDETLATTDHTYTGFDGTFTAGETLVFGQLVYFKSDGKFWKADADAVGTTEGLLVVAGVGISAEASGKFILPGSFIRDDTWNWTVGGVIYVGLNPATTGGFTQTAPNQSGDQVRIVGYAISADVMWFCPDSTYLEIT